MEASEVRGLVEDEIQGRWDHRNLHHVELRSAVLNEPRRIKMIDLQGEQRVDGWLVLEECPGMQGGYGVVYSEEDHAFGLVQFAPGYEPCLLGIYGSFLETFEAM